MSSEEISKSKRGNNSDNDDAKRSNNGGDNSVVMITCHVQGNVSSSQAYGLILSNIRRYLPMVDRNMSGMLRLFRC